MTAQPTPTTGLPPALLDHVGYLAVVMGQWSQASFEVAMATLELRPIHFDYLATLADKGACAQNRLATLLDVDAARIVALTDELEGRGLVERTTDPADRRRNLVSLTRAGRAVMAKAERLAVEVEGTLTAHLSETETRQLRSLLRKALAIA